MWIKINNSTNITFTHVNIGNMTTLFNIFHVNYPMLQQIQLHMIFATTNITFFKGLTK